MSKKFDEQIMKFEITNDKLKMEISLKDLVWLFENSPSNFYDVKVKRGKKKEFAEFIVNKLLEESNIDDNNSAWEQPFEDAFNEIFEGYEDEICKYPDEDEE